MGIPCKTAAGHAELAIRQRGLSQRHRTLLFIVDGKRSLEEVVELGAQAGVPRAYIDELMALGLVVLGAPVGPMPVDSPPAQAGRSQVPPATALDGFSAMAQGPDTASGEDPADTAYLGLAMTNTELAALDAADQAVGEVRGLLLQLLRAHAPVVGTVTMLRLRRARDLAALRALLPEVKARLGRQVGNGDVATLLERAEQLMAPLA